MPFMAATAAPEKSSGAPGSKSAADAIRHNNCLEMKAIAHFDVNLAGVGVVRSAEGVAVVQQIAAVGGGEGGLL